MAFSCPVFRVVFSPKSRLEAQNSRSSGWKPDFEPCLFCPPLSRGGLWSHVPPMGGTLDGGGYRAQLPHFSARLLKDMSGRTTEGHSPAHSGKSGKAFAETEH